MACSNRKTFHFSYEFLSNWKWFDRKWEWSEQVRSRSFITFGNKKGKKKSENRLHQNVHIVFVRWEKNLTFHLHRFFYHFSSSRHIVCYCIRQKCLSQFSLIQRNVNCWFNFNVFFSFQVLFKNSFLSLSPSLFSEPRFVYTKIAQRLKKLWHVYGKRFIFFLVLLFIVWSVEFAHRNSERILAAVFICSFRK